MLLSTGPVDPVLSWVKGKYGIQGVGHVLGAPCSSSVQQGLSSIGKSWDMGEANQYLLPMICWLELLQPQGHVGLPATASCCR